MPGSNSLPLTAVHAGMQIIVDGDRVVSVPEDVAKRFSPGDALVYVRSVDELVLIPRAEREAASTAVEAATRAFAQMGRASEASINRFYQGFAARLESDPVWNKVVEVNASDVEDARRRGRSTTRLVASDDLRRGMIEGLRVWQRAGAERGRVLETVQHQGWAVDRVAGELGVVAFVFEGRPNVLADATGVLKGGNTVVFRIGRDALGTARTIMETALTPALNDAGLPADAVRLVDSAEHAAGWALFSDRRLSLAVARGSGRAVAMLGGLAQQAGIAVSLHGTGGAWLMVSPSTEPGELSRVVARSLDRKVCNTLNVCCLPRAQADRLVPAFLNGLSQAAKQRSQTFKLHVVEGDNAACVEPLFSKRVSVLRAQGAIEEPQAEWLPETSLGLEWEWEDTPEVTLKLVDDTEHAVTLFNRYSPQFIASLLSPDPAEHELFFEWVNAPFVGDDHTRWVDGQYALGRPELGLSNWENGRLMARGGILSGDSIYTVRTRARRT